MNQEAPCAAVLEMLREAEADFLRMLDLFSKKRLNTIPFRGSWTAGQVADHIIRSNMSIVQALSLEGSPVSRKPDERAAELAAIFLDRSVKFEAPAFILPAAGPFSKARLTEDLQVSVAELVRIAGNMQPALSVRHPVFGDITRLELLYFVVYHMHRHEAQLRHIAGVTGSVPYGFFSFLFQPPVFAF